MISFLASLGIVDHIRKVKIGSFHVVGVVLKNRVEERADSTTNVTNVFTGAKGRVVGDDGGGVEASIVCQTSVMDLLELWIYFELF